jgi:hypothetical protein
VGLFDDFEDWRAGTVGWVPLDQLSARAADPSNGTRVTSLTIDASALMNRNGGDAAPLLPRAFLSSRTAVAETRTPFGAKLSPFNFTPIGTYVATPPPLSRPFARARVLSRDASYARVPHNFTLIVKGSGTTDAHVQYDDSLWLNASAGNWTGALYYEQAVGLDRNTTDAPYRGDRAHNEGLVLNREALLVRVPLVSAVTLSLSHHTHSHAQEQLRAQLRLIHTLTDDSAFTLAHAETGILDGATASRGSALRL